MILVRRTISVNYLRYPLYLDSFLPHQDRLQKRLQWFGETFHVHSRSPEVLLDRNWTLPVKRSIRDEPQGNSDINFRRTLLKFTSEMRSRTTSYRLVGLCSRPRIDRLVESVETKRAFESMEPLVRDMVQADPTRRPSMEKCGRAWVTGSLEITPVGRE